METANATLYPVCYARAWLQDAHGVGEKTWYYHQGRAPKPDVTLSGFEWYSAEQFGALKAYFNENLRKLTRTKKVCTN